MLAVILSAASVALAVTAFWNIKRLVWRFGILAAGYALAVAVNVLDREETLAYVSLSGFVVCLAALGWDVRIRRRRAQS